MKTLAHHRKLILYGRIQEGETLLLSPLSKRSCIGYLYFVRHAESLNITFHKEAIAEFFLKDGEGNFLIVPQNPGQFCENSTLPPTIKYSNYPTLKEAITQNDFVSTASKKYCHIEYCRQADEVVYVKGYLSKDRQHLIGNDIVPDAVGPHINLVSGRTLFKILDFFS
ncbi:hypothetical protein [Legionella quinlivanii]|uniref:hypothetical protein n=1 Tax=Legionella quinlivanii TaxID=45073 RepID=UPI001056C6AC|nr:hypothetical protein [Legionella quinlivanii]